MKTQFILHAAVYLLLLLAVGCQSGKKQSGSEEAKLYSTVPLEYATGFRIDSINAQRRRLVVFNPKDLSEEFGRFDLLSQEYDKPLKNGEIKLPCKRIICLSSTQLSYFFELEDIDNIVGCNSSRFLFHKEFTSKLESGIVKQVGKEGKFNIELIASLDPDVIFVSPFKTGGFDAIRNLGIPLVPMAAYSEMAPLGRAEWIKMMAPFVGQEAKADSIFEATSSEYNRLKNLVAKVDHRPTVFSGKMKGSAWYVPGGKSFFAHFFKDAGADYIIKNDLTGATPMDYETVYNEASSCDYWRLLTSSEEGFDKQALAKEDERYTYFDAFKNNKVLACNLREIPYREQSSVKPHILLADYISHFHPELLPNHIPVYWSVLK